MMRAHCRETRIFALIVMGALALGWFACSPGQPQSKMEVEISRTSILLVTLDTTRADSLGFESDAVETPVLDALADRGVRFSQAWTTVPMR